MRFFVEVAVSLVLGTSLGQQAHGLDTSACEVIAEAGTCDDQFGSDLCDSVLQSPQDESINDTGLYLEESCLELAGDDTGLGLSLLGEVCLYQVQVQALSQGGRGAPALVELLSNSLPVLVVLFLYFLMPMGFFVLVLARRAKLYKDLRVAEQDPSSVQALRSQESMSADEVLPVYVSFHRLSYSVKLNAGGLADAKKRNGGKTPSTPGWNRKKIIKNISGAFVPGTLSAVMGPSGSGKSTVLDIIADRKQGGYTTGKILINGRERTRLFKRVSAYVLQFDALFPHLTVREVLQYTAELRIPGGSLKAKKEAVAVVIKQLDLTRVADTKIGGGDSGISGISGGQARRVTVGIELVTRPMIIFLDEPTTGLDAFSSLQLVRTLRMLADTGRTVVCTIHQPRPDIFDLFNTMLLVKDGEVAYFGAVADIKPYFATVGIVIGDDVSVADFVVDLTYSGDSGGGAPAPGGSTGAQTVAALAETFHLSDESRELEALCAALEDRSLPGLPPPAASLFAECDPDTGAVIRHDMRFSQSIFQQTFILLRRSYKNIGRDSTYFTNVGLQMSQFLFYGLLFLGLRTETLDDINAGEVLGIADPNYLFILQQRAFLFQVMNTIMLIEVVVIANAFVEKKIFRREHASGAYSILAYHAQFIVRFFVDAAWKGVLASVLCYFFPPSRLDADAFFFFAAVLMVASTLGSSLAFLMVSLIPNAEGASNIHSQILGTFGLYSGFFLFPNLIPVFMEWIYFLLPFKYAYEALEWNQFTCMTIGERDQLFAVDPTLNRWTNLVIFMLYPPIFHAAAIAASFFHTRPKSYFVQKCPVFFSKENFEEAPGHGSAASAAAVPVAPVAPASPGAGAGAGAGADAGGSAQPQAVAAPQIDPAASPQQQQQQEAAAAPAEVEMTVR